MLTPELNYKNILCVLHNTKHITIDTQLYIYEIVILFVRLKFAPFFRSMQICAKQLFNFKVDFLGTDPSTQFIQSTYKFPHFHPSESGYEVWGTTEKNRRR